MGLIKMELISVIITTCNRNADMLRRAVQSVQNQSYTNWELLIVDDSPETFSGRKEVETLITSINDKRIQYIKQPQNMGAQVARNTGLAIARGEWINFLDDDDEFLPDKLEAQLNAAKEHNVLWVTGKAIIFNDSTGKEKNLGYKYYSGNVYSELLCKNFIPSITPLVNRKCYEKVGNFDEDLQSAQDYDMWLRIAKEYPLYCLNIPGVIIHMHGNGRITANPVKRIQGLTSIINKYQEDLSMNPKLYSKKVVYLIKYYFMLGECENAQQLLCKANKISGKYVLKNYACYIYFLLKYGIGIKFKSRKKV